MLQTLAAGCLRPRAVARLQLWQSQKAHNPFRSFGGSSLFRQDTPAVEASKGPRKSPLERKIEKLTAKVERPPSNSSILIEHIHKNGPRTKAQLYTELKDQLALKSKVDLTKMLKHLQRLGVLLAKPPPQTAKALEFDAQRLTNTVPPPGPMSTKDPPKPLIPSHAIIKDASPEELLAAANKIAQNFEATKEPNYMYRLSATSAKKKPNQIKYRKQLERARQEKESQAASADAPAVEQS